MGNKKKTQIVEEPLITEVSILNQVSEEIVEDEKSDEFIDEVSTDVISEEIDWKMEDVLQRKDALESGLISTLLDKTRSRLLIGKNKGFLANLEARFPRLKGFNFTGFSSRASYTEEEKIYFMKNNFDWFQVNGSCYYDFGKQLGTSGVYLPTGNKWAVCTIEQFVDVILRDVDVNKGKHRASYEDTSNKFPRGSYWKGREITKYNVDKFIIDYCEGKIARMDGVGSLPTSVKEDLLKMVADSK